MAQVSFGLRQRAKRVCIHIGVTIPNTNMFDVVSDNKVMFPYNV